MDNIYDYKRYAILYVDDEEMSLKYFSRAFGSSFRIFTANNAEEGFRILADHQDEIGVIMSDQRMPGEKGVQFLERARRLRPRIIRILATAYTDLDAAIDAVNTGAIYKYVTKPWDIPQLETTLKRSLEFYIVQTERDYLLREKLSVLHKMVITDRVLSLGVLAAGIGHHIRDSMSAVRAFLELTPEMLHRENLDLTELRNPTFWQDFHRNVQSRVKQVLDVLDNLATPMPGGSAFETPVQLREALDAALTELRTDLDRRHISVVNLIPESLPAVHVDAPKFRKLFPLILRDELAHLPENSVIRVEASLQQRPGSKPEIEITINDNGPGMPHHAILSMFDPFLMRKQMPQEFGVLLMACYFIVHHHGGRIDVRPSESQGLTFTVHLPVQPEALDGADQGEQFLVRAMTNERLWERLLASS
jgi:two-component system, probable response regulator PhcQ